MLPFDRLTRTIDEWARARRVSDVVIQIGSGEYVPQAAPSVRMLAPAEFESHIRKSNLVVSHSGIGTVLSCMQAEKPMVLLPRLKVLGEVNTEHQMQSANWMRAKSGIWVALDESELMARMDDFLEGRLNESPAGLGAYASGDLIDNVRRFIFSE